MIDEYQGALRLRKKRPAYTVDEAARRFTSNAKWDQGLKARLARQEDIPFSFENVRSVQYRPYVKQYGYVDRRVSWSKYQQDSIFPPTVSEVGPILGRGTANRAICVPGVGATKGFSPLMVDTMPVLELVSKGQCCPPYRYERRIASSASRESAPTSRARFSSRTECPTSTSSNSASVSRDGPTPTYPRGVFDETGLFETGVERVDNITDTALRAFQEHYGDETITKDAIFDYVYGVLHAPAYRERFANDLAKALPRIPMAADFGAFRGGWPRLGGPASWLRDLR